MPIIKVNDINMYYEIHGAGETSCHDSWVRDWFFYI